MQNIELLKKELSYYNYVSFDVFDTLIFRTVSNYKSIFDIVSILYKENYGEFLKNFPKDRILAEHKARKYKKGKEINIEMIYENLPYNDIIRNRLRDIEEQCEIQNVVPNKVMVDILLWCKKQNKKIIIITDMYLPRFVFEKIMKKINVEYDYMFISGEEGETKRTGKLFPIVLKKLQIHPSELIHIGDDYNNDIQKPQEYGIKSLERIQSPINLPRYIKLNKKDILQDHLYNFILRQSQNQSNITNAFRIGYSILGPLMLEFCRWIHKIKNEENIDSLLFVAREGYFIKQCYELIYSEKTEYIRLNRNLLRLPLLQFENPINSLIEYLPDCREIKWQQIFNALLISNHTEASLYIKSKIKNFDYNKSILKSDLRQHKFDNILSILIKKQKDIINEQASLLNQYIEEKKLTKGKIGLINNSMNGSGQSMIENYLTKNNYSSNIVGIQFVKREKCIQRLGKRCRAWITENNITHLSSYLFQINCLLLEHLLFEPAGTSLYFTKSNSSVEAVCEQPRSEKNNFHFIESVQSIALQFIKDYLNNLNLNLGMQSYHNYLNSIKHPHKEDALVLCNLNDDDINGDKFLSDCSLNLSIKQIIKGRIPEQIQWVEGYLAAKNLPAIYYFTYHLRMMLRCYRDTTKYIISDIKTIFNHLKINYYAQ